MGLQPSVLESVLFQFTGFKSPKNSQVLISLLFLESSPLEPQLSVGDLPAPIAISLSIRFTLTSFLIFAVPIQFRQLREAPLATAPNSIPNQITFTQPGPPLLVQYNIHIKKEICRIISSPSMCCRHLRYYQPNVYHYHSTPWRYRSQAFSSFEQQGHLGFSQK